MPILGTASADSLAGTSADDSIYGDAGNDTIDAGEGNDFISGGDGGDSIVGGPGIDSISGGAGNDLIRAGDGNDWVNYLGETGDDTVYGGAGDDFISLPSSTGIKTLYGESGNDTLQGGVDNDIIDGGEGSDSIHGGEGRDSLIGGLNDDLIEGAQGNDTIDGGEGNDFINGGEGSDSISGGLGVDSILGGSGDDFIDAGAGDDWLSYVGESGEDTVYGGDGHDLLNFNGSSGKKRLFGQAGQDTLNGGVDDDTLEGGDDNDSLTGGGGNDLLVGGLGDDMLLGGVGDDTLEGADGSDYLSGGDGADSILAGADSDSIVGGAGNDFIDAGAGDDWLSYAGESGDDTVYGGDGHDLLNFNGSSGKKRLFGQAGQDTLNGGVDDDTLEGGDDNDLLNGGGGNDSLIGGLHDDHIDGGLGNDTIDAGDGNDFIAGDDGADVIFGGPGADSINGETGDDFIDAGAGDDWLSYAGEYGNDTVYGGDGNDLLNFSDSLGIKRLYGGDGNDTVFGGDDNDTLDGGAGGDLLSGGGGDDTYFIDSRFDRLLDSDGTDTAIVSADWVKIPSTIEQVSYVDGAKALPYWISALLYDNASGSYFRSLLADANNFFFVFPSSIPDYDTDSDHADGYRAFNSTQQANTRAALAYLETVVDLNFVETDNPTRLNALAFALNRQSGSGGYSLAPSDQFMGSDVFLNDVDYNASLDPGTYGAQVLIHEIGHAIGLKHPFDEADADGGIAEPPYLEGDEDSTRWTQMSYTHRPDDYRLSFSPLDIAALHYLYGPSPSRRSGRDTYVLQSDASNFVWDGAGEDTLDASAASLGLHLSLEAGEWSYFGAAPAASITEPGQITINFGSVIEHAIGSAFADRIVGNDVSNSLQGGDGADHLEGRAGDDYLDGGAGDDSLDGGAGDDHLYGRPGDDTLRGGDGHDTAYFAGTRNEYKVTWNPDEKLIKLNSSADGADTLIDIETLAFSDVTVSASTFETSLFVESMFTPLPRVRIKTSVGDLVVELESDRAPVTVTNFLRYVDADYYDGTEFHRIISTFMAQGGGYDYVGGQYVYKTPLFPAIALEKTSATGLSNLAGTLAMARTSVANSATSQFFVNFVDNKFLDAASQQDGNGYAVFGRVVPSVTASTTLQALKQVTVVANSTGEVSQPTSAITLLDVLTEPAAATALPTGSVTISGGARQGATLSAGNTLVDADGIPAAGQTGAISYYWKADGVIIPGATSATFTPTQTHVGKAISVAASYTDLKGTTGYVTSEAFTVSNINDRPTGRVLIQGTPTAGATLTASHTLADLDGIPATGQAGAITWQWRVDGVPVPGATQSTFSVAAADVGKPITVSASYVDLGGAAESVLSAAAGSYVPTPASSLPRAWLRTSYGDLLFELEDEKAPITVNNFVQYLKAGFYNNTVFHRVIDDFMVQGGGFTFNSSTGQYTPKEATSPAITLEKTTTTGLSNLRGTIAMARTNDPNSATSEFFINDVDNLGLNADRNPDGSGYAVFGRLVDGYATLDLLSQVPVTRNGNELSLPTTVISVLGSYYDPAPPAGDVVITGLPMQGQTLRAEHTLTDPDGFGSYGVLAWQWRVDGVPVSNSGGASFLVPESAVGSTVSVQAIYRDAQSNFGYVSSPPSAVVVALPPSVALYSHKTQLKPGQAATMVFTLSHASTDFSADDLTVSGGVVSNFAGSGLLYTATFTPTAGATNGSVRVASGKFMDGSGNINSDGSEADNVISFAIQASAPTFTGAQGMVYHWKTHVPLSGVQVSAALVSAGSVQAGTALTVDAGATGFYEIGLSQSGTYQFDASRGLTTGETGNAINAADALAALKLSVGLNPNVDPDGTGPLTAPPVSPYQFLAADVNGDGRVTAADALAILKMAVKRPDAPLREWQFVHEGFDFWNEAAASGQGAFNTTRSSVPAAATLPADIAWAGGKDINLVAVLKGDVNGSWASPAGSQALSDAYFHGLVSSNTSLMNINQFGISATPVL